eukprot:TRINITY_DN2200_c0_g1_i1.p1 TRINITY_DN2200_c0_g1~~TRINITY_DN2200_c0_g1_i1.p1  ORF type:complete len:256 (-),score=10.40 TRINITY_DN2200_c0_g1_i1:60-728(-)
MGIETEQRQSENVHFAHAQVSPILPQVGAKYIYRNRGTLFSCWEDGYPEILRGRISEEDHHQFMKELNRIRLAGKGATIATICFIGLWYIGYPVALGVIFSQFEDVNFLPYWFAYLGSLPLGICLLSTFAIMRYRKMKHRLGQVLARYQETLFSPCGLKIDWDPRSQTVLAIDEVVGYAAPQIVNQGYMVPPQPQVTYYQPQPSYGSVAPPAYGVPLNDLRV